MTIAFQKNDVQALETTNHYRQWAFIQLNNLNEFYCLDTLYFHESRWNPNAVSPSGNINVYSHEPKQVGDGWMFVDGAATATIGKTDPTDWQNSLRRI